MRFRVLGLLGLLTASCTGLRFPAEVARPGSGAFPAPFRAAELVDALPYGALPPLTAPVHAGVDVVDPAPAEPLAVIELAGAVRAYPLSILIWHEAVNDSIEGIPVLVAYSPLTDSVTAWVRRDAGRTFTFAASGKSYAGTGVLADRETSSLWLPPTGRAVAGPSKGTSLIAVPVVLAPASAYRDADPTGAVVSPETGFTRPYGRSPYRGYVDQTSPPRRFFLREPDPRLPAMSLVLALPGNPVYPFDAIREAGVVNDEDVVVVWIPGVASALDRGVIADSRDTGSAAAFVRTLDGARLTFDPAPGGGMRDRQTGSIWDVFGTARTGPMAGRSLEPLAAVRSLWFAWAVVDAGARVYAGPGGG